MSPKPRNPKPRQGVEWQGLINEVGSMRAMSQEAAGQKGSRCV